MVTTLSIIFGLLSASQILSGKFLLATLLFVVAYYLDCVDGKLARKYHMTSQFGDYYDHFGDLFKLVVIIYALFKSNKTRGTSTKQLIFVGIVIVLTVLECAHFGYQETIYDKKHESAFLNVLRKMVSFDKNPDETIHYTKYFGCGFWMLCFALIIFFWRK
jgi:phosphatidylglycerophosphate synthase